MAIFTNCAIISLIHLLPRSSKVLQSWGHKPPCSWLKLNKAPWGTSVPIKQGEGCTTSLPLSPLQSPSSTSNCQPSKTRNCSLFRSSPWFWEILSLVFSFACFIAIVVTLLVYNNKPSPNLPQGVTLNAIISILATKSKASLAFVASESIGQLKWTWF